MSFLGDWAKKHLSVRLDSHTLGNLAKNVAPALAFTPAGVLGAGALATLGDLGRGRNIKQAALSGVENAALGGGLASLGAKVGVGTGAHLGFGLGESGAATGAAGGSPDIASEYGAEPDVIPKPAGLSFGGTPTPSLPPASITPTAGVGAPAIAPTAADLPTPGGSGFLSKIGGFAKDNPTAVALGLQGLGSIAGSSSENRLRNAQAAGIEGQTTLTADQAARRKASDAALAPYWSALANAGPNRPAPAPNPYLPAGA